MKRLFNWTIATVAMVLLAIGLPRQQAKAQPGASVSFQMFYDELSPYGQWIDDPDYGYVWAPEVDDDFRPYYTNGRWVMTDYGNTWISNYNWGWAPFHYGRWTYDNYYGWIWVPGDQWGPAWVSWRSGGGYYGWAPLGPGINVSLSLGNNYATPYDWWTFIPCQNIYSPNYYSYWRGPRYNTTIINQTTIVNNYYNNRYVYGPRRNEVERYTGGRVNVYSIRNEQRPGRSAVSRNEVAIFRPQVVRNDRNSFREAPRNAVHAERPVGDRNYRDNRAGLDRDRQRPVENQPVNRDNRFQRDLDRNNVQRDRMYQNENRMQQQPDRSNMRDEMMRTQREQENMQRQNEQRAAQDRQRVERDNEMTAQREMMRQRDNDQRMQFERQRAERENAQRMQVERAQRDNQMRMQEMSNRQQMMEQRQMQQQQQQQQRMQFERQQQQQQQREWRRPEPQQQMQRMERPQMERPQPAGDRGRPFGRGR